MSVTQTADDVRRQLDAKNGRLLEIDSRLADLPDELERARHAAGKAVAAGKGATAGQRRVRALSEEQDALSRAKDVLAEEIADLNRQLDGAVRRAAHEDLRRADIHARALRTKVLNRLAELWREELSPLAEQLESATGALLHAAHQASPTGMASSTVHANIANEGVRLREALEAIARCAKDPDGPGVMPEGAGERPFLARDRPPRQRPASLAHR
jgi:hypothetical protein